MTGSASDPLAAAEEALWLLQAMARDKGLSNLALAIRLPDPVDASVVADALRALADRHPDLRQRFPVDGSTPVRVRAPEGEVRPVVEETDGTLEFVRRPFDLATGPLIRAAVTGRTVVLVVHHLVADGNALRVLAEELLALCGGAALGAPQAPAAPPTARPESVRYWRQRLAGYQAAGARLDTSRDIAAESTFEAGHVTRRLSDRATAAVAGLRRAKLAKATTATIRRTLITVPARIASSARRLTLHLPAGWPWQTAWTRLFTHTCGPPTPAVN